MNILELPFNQHLGLTMVHHNDEDVVCLKPELHHQNHLGTIHAGAVYSVAEAASGHALLTRTCLPPNAVVAVLRSSKVKYRRPASGRLIARATVDDESISRLEDQWNTKGRVLFDIRVQVFTDDDTEVFTGEFKWFASDSRESSNP